MKKSVTATESVEATSAQVHPLLKNHMIVSNKTVDYNNLTAFEATSMAAVLVLAVLVGTVQALTLI